jgi:hypothetical protein
MDMQFKECGPEDQICCLDNDNDDEVSTSSEYADSDFSTSSAAESLPNSQSLQIPQGRPGPRVPLALQAVYLESCKEQAEDEPPPQPKMPVYISERVSFFAICLMSRSSALALTHNPFYAVISSTVSGKRTQ